MQDDGEKMAAVAKRVTARMHDAGASVALKFGPVLRAMVEHIEAASNASDLAVISVPSLGVKEKSAIFSRMLFRLLRSPHASFRAAKQTSLGNLGGLNYFVLALFIYATCQRTRNDGMLALFVSGKTSVGKSICLEQPLMQNSHQLLSTASSGDAGCGRFGLKNKNVIMLRDTTLRNIFSNDLDRIKCIARGEAVSVKIHSSTELLSSSFLFVSSNERLFEHVYITPSGFREFLTSDVKGLKQAKLEHLEAIRARFLELHVRKRCEQDAEDLKHSHNFQRLHLILGIYSYCLKLLRDTEPADFPTEHMYHYVVSGLIKNAAAFAQAHSLDKEAEKRLNVALLRLKVKFSVQPLPAKACLKN